MVLKLYNTLTRAVEEFQPLNPAGPVTVYSCGPTVYNYAHIGNWRAFMTADWLRRSLEYNGLSVKQVMNITDVDDKTIAGAKAAGLALGDFTKKYEQIFLTDLDSLNIRRPLLVRATEHVSEMIALIETLFKRGFAYAASDGVYFAVGQFPSYGRFRKAIRPETFEPEASRTRDKRDPRDFALWKFHRPEDGSAKWEASFGVGRPGWHIECSAMSMRELGESFDIHMGGHDLMFPHHENELAQSEAASGKILARYWLHNDFVNVEGQKMSKSLGNVLTLSDLANRGLTPLAYRYWLMTAHYRTLVNFTWEAAQAAQTAFERVSEAIADLGEEVGVVDSDYQKRFTDAVNNDLGLPQALALLHELLADQNLLPADKRATVLDFDRVLGLKLSDIEGLTIPPKIQELVNQRAAARQNRDWSKADALRQEIEAAGYLVADTPAGQKVSRKL